MATSNSRDVRLNILVDAIGQENVDKLKDALNALATAGGDAAPEFERLTGEIEKLVDQQRAIATLRDAAAEVERLANAETDAAARLAGLNQALTEQRSALDLARQAYDQSTKAVQEARNANTDIATAIRTLKAETSSAAKDTDAYRGRLAELIRQQGEGKKTVDALALAQRQASSEVTAAERAVSRLETAQTKQARAAQSAADAVAQQQGALAEAQQQAQAMGVSTENLAEAETALAQRVAQTTTSIEERTAAIRQATAFDEAAWQREADAIVSALEAQRQMQRETEVLLATQRELAAQNAFEEQAKEAQRLAQAADYVRFWERSLREAEDAERAVAQAAEDAARRIDNAFGNLGLRSVAQVRDEINQVRADMALLAASGQLTGAELANAFRQADQRVAVLEREIRGLTGQLTLADQAANLFKNSLGQIAAGNVIADAVGYLVNKVKELGRSFIEVTAQTERTRLGLQTVYKDANVAAAQFDFLRSTANAAGVSIGAINDAFLRFTAAMKGANQPLAVTNELFAAVTRAGATLGLTGEQVSGALDALGQIASKNVVSMEELRQQLGDRLPGALSAAARGLGITEQQLVKLVEAGQLTARDFFPAFTQGLQSMVGNTNTLAGAWGRFTNLLRESAIAIGDGGGLDVLKGLLLALGAAVSVVLVPLQGFVETINLAAKGAGLFLAALVTGDYKGALEAFGEEVEKSATRIKTFHGAITTALSSQDQQTQTLRAGTAAFGANTSAVLANAAAQAQAGGAATAAGNAFVQQLVKLQQNAQATEAAVTASEKLLKAKQDETKAVVSAAQLSGNVQASLEAQASASLQVASASEQVTAARLRELQVTEGAIAAINRERDVQGNLASDRQLLLDKLNKTLVVQQAALEQSQASTAELRQQALAAQAASEAYADNSTKLQAYQQAMLAARTTGDILRAQVQAQTTALAELNDQLETGKITQERYNQARSDLLSSTEQMNAALGNAARYESLYRDAVNDSVKAIGLKSSAAQAELSITAAKATVDQKHYEVMAETARQQGNVAAATYYTIEAKKAEIQQIQLSVQIKQLELDAEKQSIEVQKAALDPADKLYQQKVKELDIRLRVIEAKRIEANASLEGIKALEREITNLRLYGDERGRAAASTNGDTSATNANTDARNRNADAIDRQAQAERNRLNVDKEGYSTNTAGQRVVAGGELTSLTGIYNFLKSAGVTDEARARAIAREFGDAQGNIPYFNNPGQKKYGGDTLSAALLKAAQQETFKPASTTPAPAPAAPAATYAVTITLPDGSSGVVNAASAADAQNLTSLLGRLGTAKRTAG